MATAKRDAAFRNETPSASQASKRRFVSSPFAPFLVGLNDANAVKVDHDLMNHSYLPKCYVAAGYILDKFIGSNKSHRELLKEFRDRFPCLEYFEQYTKNLGRVIEQAQDLINLCPETANILLKIFKTNDRSRGIYEHQHTKFKFDKGDICLVCRPLPNKGELDLKNFLEIFYTEQIVLGSTPKEIHDKIIGVNTVIANNFNARCKNKSSFIYPVSQALETELAKTKKLAHDNKAYTDSIIETLSQNFKKYGDNLKSCSAFLYYGLRISHREIGRLDSTIFTFQTPTVQLETAIIKLPKLKKVT